MEVLDGVDNHPAADEIYEMVRQKLPHISLGTVYRNLDILSEYGLIRKLEFAGSQRRFDGIARNHYHLRCTGCGRVEDAPVEPVAMLEEELRKVSDYDVIGHRLEFIGLCPGCKQKEQASKVAEN
jgi:Fur family ferric uptake transcriptional regulator